MDAVQGTACCNNNIVWFGTNRDKYHVKDECNTVVLELDIYGRIAGYRWGIGLLTVLTITPLTDRFWRKKPYWGKKKKTQKHKKHRDGRTNNVNTAIEDKYTKTQKHTKHGQWHWNKNRGKNTKTHKKTHNIEEQFFLKNTKIHKIQTTHLVILGLITSHIW